MAADDDEDDIQRTHKNTNIKLRLLALFAKLPLPFLLRLLFARLQST